MKTFPAAHVIDCDTLQPNTVHVHREDVYDTQGSVPLTTWFFSFSVTIDWQEGTKLNKARMDQVNENGLSVYILDLTNTLLHQKAEPHSKGCWSVDASTLKGFFPRPRQNSCRTSIRCPRAPQRQRAHIPTFKSHPKIYNLCTYRMDNLQPRPLGKMLEL